MVRCTTMSATLHAPCMETEMPHMPAQYKILYHISMRFASTLVLLSDLIVPWSREGRSAPFSQAATRPTSSICARSCSDDVPILRLQAYLQAIQQWELCMLDI